MFATRSELLDELELAIQGGAAEKRLQTVRRWSWLCTISQRVVPANAGTHHPWPQK